MDIDENDELALLAMKEDLKVRNRKNKYMDSKNIMKDDDESASSLNQMGNNYTYQQIKDKSINKEVS
jgi:hypothetical protein